MHGRHMFKQKITEDIRNLLERNINQTSCFIDEREAGSYGTEFRVLTKAHGECLLAVRVERQ